MPSTAPESSYTVSAPFALEAVEVLLHRALSAIAEENPDRDCGAWLDDSIYVVLDENLPRLDVSDAQPLLAFMAAARFGVRIALATVNNPLADTSAALGECIAMLKKGILEAAESTRSDRRVDARRAAVAGTSAPDGLGERPCRL